MSNITRLSSVFNVCRRMAIRNFSQQVEKSSAQTTAEKANISLSHTHRPNDFERKVLVWTGRFKSESEIPAMINQEVMERARNRMRIRIANIFMALTAIGCCIMIYSGKKAAERGETVHQMNVDWHKQYNEKTGRKETDFSTHFDKVAEAGTKSQN